MMHPVSEIETTLSLLPEEKKNAGDPSSGIPQSNLSSMMQPLIKRLSSATHINCLREETNNSINLFHHENFRSPPKEIDNSIEKYKR